jgi:hypothetical protein
MNYPSVFYYCSRNISDAISGFPVLSQSFLDGDRIQELYFWFLLSEQWVEITGHATR